MHITEANKIILKLLRKNIISYERLQREWNLQFIRRGGVP
jgi:hypothetical protein